MSEALWASIQAQPLGQRRRPEYGK